MCRDGDGPCHVLWLQQMIDFIQHLLFVVLQLSGREASPPLVVGVATMTMVMSQEVSVERTLSFGVLQTNVLARGFISLGGWIWRVVWICKKVHKSLHFVHGGRAERVQRALYLVGRQVVRLGNAMHDPSKRAFSF